jgi:hypothetical protein
MFQFRIMSEINYKHSDIRRDSLNGWLDPSQYSFRGLVCFCVNIIYAIPLGPVLFLFPAFGMITDIP